MVIVTGATGLVGSVIIDHFASRNIPVTGLYRKKHSEDNTHVKWAEADVTDIESLTKSFAGASAVVHAAAVVSFSQRSKEKMFHVNVEGTANVVNACLQSGVKRLIHVSSVAALGKIPNQNVIDENATWTVSDKTTNYGLSKYLAELEVFRGEAEGISVAMVNPSIILATEKNQRSSSKLFQYIFDEQPFYTDGQLNYVDARDVAEMILRLYENTSLKGRYIANAGRVAWKIFFDKIANRFNKKPPSIKVPHALAQLAASAEWLRSLLTGQEPIITKETARVARQQIFFSNKKACKELALPFRELDETLDWCCQAFLANRGKV